VSFFGNGFKVDSFIKLHIFGMDSQDFESTDLIRDTNIDLSIKSTESSECRVEGVRSVGCSDDNDMSSCLEAVHKGK